MIRIHQVVPIQSALTSRGKMLTIRLPAETLAAVNESARKDGVTQNQWCLALIDRALRERAFQSKPSTK
jgi:hypothetical protein